MPLNAGSGLNPYQTTNGSVEGLNTHIPLTSRRGQSARIAQIQARTNDFDSGSNSELLNYF